MRCWQASTGQKFGVNIALTVNKAQLLERVVQILNLRTRSHEQAITKRPGRRASCASEHAISTRWQRQRSERVDVGDWKGEQRWTKFNGFGDCFKTPRRSKPREDLLQKPTASEKMTEKKVIIKQEEAFPCLVVPDGDSKNTVVSAS